MIWIVSLSSPHHAQSPSQSISSLFLPGKANSPRLKACFEILSLTSGQINLCEKYKMKRRMQRSRVSLILSRRSLRTPIPKERGSRMPLVRKIDGRDWRNQFGPLRLFLTTRPATPSLNSRTACPTHDGPCANTTERWNRISN